MKNALALIEQFRPKNAKEVLRKNDEKLRMQLEQQNDKLKEESKA